MNLLRSLLWHLDTSRRARSARHTWPYDDDLMAVATAVGVVTPTNHLKEQH